MTRRILLVDDEPSVRATVAANLELAGFEVVEAEDGAKAVAAVESGQTFHVVLSDVRMPGMSGVELFKKLKAGRPELPVILMTAFAVEDQIHDAIAHGVFAVFSKPFEVDDALPALERAIRNPIVLVLDGSEQKARELTESLARSGLRAQGLDSVALAVRTVQDGQVDVCVIDQSIAGPAGTPGAQAIRKASAAVLLVVVSDEVSPEVMARVAAAAPQAFLKRPLKPGELVSTIARARGKP